MGKSDKKEKRKKEKKKEKKEEKEHKKRRRRSPSTDSSSSGSSTDEEEYKRRKADKLAMKVAQHLKKHKVTGIDYTDNDNPFGDSNLTERFVWGKKISKELASGRDVRDMTAKAEMRRQAERLEEIEKVKKRREQREAEREAMAEELDMIQRERAIAEAVELEKKEEEFHLEQAKSRTQRRMESGRPKAIDLLAHTLFQLEGMEPQQDDPVSIIASLTLLELKHLKEDIEAFQELDKHDALHADFWTAAYAVAEKEHYEQQKQEDIDRAQLRGESIPAKYTEREPGWHETIDADVQEMLTGKGYENLAQLQREIERQLDSGEAADPEYWGAVLRRLALHKARARLRSIHEDKLRQYVARQLGGVDVAEAMGWGREDAPAGAQLAAARAAALAAQQQEEEYPEEEGEEEAPAAAARARRPAAAGGVADENEIELDVGEEEEEGEPELDPELLALARPPEELAAEAGEEEGPKDKEQLVARGEPRSWEDLSDTEQDDKHREPGLYSPRPLLPTAYAGQEFEEEEEDWRLLQLMRAQVRYKEVQRYKDVTAAQAAARPAQAAADRIFRRVTARPGEAHRMLGGGTMATRFLAQAAPLGAQGAGPRNQPRVLGSEAPQQADDAAEAAFRAAAGRMMGDLGTSGDAPFGGEVPTAPDSQVYWWHEKYRPRRPKYFNRVHTGYEWNKYNQTHYDGDNPPPKTVQGYKFNIFYPELLDKTKAPTYAVDRDPTSEDGGTCILRFIAGPPYEDLAFRILNKEWEYNHKRGFKCVFERGILHLYFNFKRQRYRR